MALLSVANVEFAIGDRPLLEGVSLTLQAGEHVGLVGRNGCGKSTLLKLIAGLDNLKLDDGQIQLASGATAGYLHQDPRLDADLTLRQEALSAVASRDALQAKLDQLADAMGEAPPEDIDRLLEEYAAVEHQMEAAGGYTGEHVIDQTLVGVGLDESLWDVPVPGLSGGQKGRLALAKLLLTGPDVLLLDEPTNHLDIAGRTWLEQYLADYRGAVLVISHDRWLLDRCVRKIYELQNGVLEEYPGNYHAYLEQRHVRRLDQQRAREKQQTHIKQQQAFIDRYKAGQRAKQAHGRQKRLERYIRDELIEAPPELADMSLKLEPKTRSGDLVIEAERLGVTHDQNQLFADLDLSLKRGERLGIIGPNGAGKSTLVRCLLGEQKPTAGKSRLGAQVSVGHFTQSHDHLDGTLSVVEYLRKHVPGQMEQPARDLAGAFLFRGDEQDKPMSAFSGGERSRAVLAGLMAEGHNLLVLDEPTNHLDIPSTERLEDALLGYTSSEKRFSKGSVVGQAGTLILISHDRMLLDKLVDRMVILNGQGNAKLVLGSYHDHADLIEKPANTPAGDPPAKKPAPATKPAGDRNPKAKSKGKMKSRPFGGLSDAKLESRIESLESKVAELDQQLADPAIYQDHKRFSDLQNQREKLAGELAPLEMEWTERAG
jgi:ATP-binding cassette subfamily F protein 3